VPRRPSRTRNAGSSQGAPERSRKGMASAELWPGRRWQARSRSPDAATRGRTASGASPRPQSTIAGVIYLEARPAEEDVADHEASTTATNETSPSQASRSCSLSRALRPVGRTRRLLTLRILEDVFGCLSPVLIHDCLLLPSRDGPAAPFTTAPGRRALSATARRLERARGPLRWPAHLTQPLPGIAGASTQPIHLTTSLVKVYGTGLASFG